jgi:ribosomal protein L24E
MDRPSSNRTDLATWLPPELSPRTGREPRNVAWAFENANAAICARKKVGDVMLLPTVIFMMILWPVLLPALVTAFHAVLNRRRNSRRVAWAVTTNRLVGVTLR